MDVIERLSRIRSGPGVPLISDSKRKAYIESIRWKGEIYCPACKSTLKRVPIQEKWYETPSYDPFTGATLSFVQQHGPIGLMVCSLDEEPRMSILSYSGPSFQKQFSDMDRPRHGMYYVDTPPL